MPLTPQILIVALEGNYAVLGSVEKWDISKRDCASSKEAELGEELVLEGACKRNRDYCILRSESYG